MSREELDAIRDSQVPAVHYWNAAVQQLAFWDQAVKLQLERIEAKQAADSRQFIYDAMFLVIAVHRLRRACQFAAERFKAGTWQRADIDRAVSPFDIGFAALTDIRHATEHFENWLMGKGWTQLAPTRPGYPYRTQFTHDWSSTADARCLVTIDDTEVDVLAAARAASAMGFAVNNVFNADADKDLVHDIWAKDNSSRTDPVT